MHTNRFFILIVDQCLKIHLLDKPHQPLYNGLFNGIYCKPTHLQVACVVWIWRNKFLSGNTNMLRDFEKIAIICLFMLIKKHVFANLKKFSTKSNFQTFCISLYILYIKNAKFMLLQSDFQSPPENKPTNYFSLARSHLLGSEWRALGSKNSSVPSYLWLDSSQNWCWDQLA